MTARNITTRQVPGGTITVAEYGRGLSRFQRYAAQRREREHARGMLVCNSGARFHGGTPRNALSRGRPKGAA